MNTVWLKAAGIRALKTFAQTAGSVSPRRYGPSVPVLSTGSAATT